jgi:hypothetical protein
MKTISEEELQQLDAECGVTIHSSVFALSAYEQGLLGHCADDAHCCYRVDPHL